MPGDENGDNTEEAGDVLQANAGKVETGQGEDGQEGEKGTVLLRPAAGMDA